jgi:hypothetical protein
MAPMRDWRREAREAVRREMWSLRGPNQIVKVLPAGGTAASTLGGYITLGKFLLNKTPGQIETALGLPAGYLARGARIYRFIRLPQVSEYEYELTAEFPDGLAYSGLQQPLRSFGKSNDPSMEDQTRSSNSS